MEAPENGASELPREKAVGNGSATCAPGNGVSKLPQASPTTSPDPEQSKPSGVPAWLILDRIVHRSRRHCGVVKDDATASALANDCVGRPLRASLRIAHPPAVSRLYLHWKGRPSIDCGEPKVIAAHGSCILFRMCVPFEDPMWWSCTASFPVDYLVYSSSTAKPTLTLLPPCFDGGHTDESDKYFQPYCIQNQRVMLDRLMGILCHGEDDGEFTVADLTYCSRTEVQLCLLHHPPPATSEIPIQWTIKRLQIPPDMKINLRSWWNDVVVPIDGRRLCWVDYYQGLLLIDVLADSQPDQLLQFIPLPSQALKHRRLYKDAGERDPFRCVGVTDAGIIKLVCVLTKEPPSPYPFTITTWILDVHRGEWRKDVDTTVGAKDFFHLCGTGQSCLPLVQPSFPMVSLVNRDVICFLLEDQDRSRFWVVEVDMRNKKLQSSSLYINEEEEEGYPPKRGRRCCFFGYNFIPSKFSSYLSENAITSWELSEKMQEAKKERVMKKIGLEAKSEKMPEAKKESDEEDWSGSKIEVIYWMDDSTF